MSGKFIVIEGLEGAGKTTAKTIATEILHCHHVTNIINTREPGGTPLAEALRHLIKEGLAEEKITHTAELLMLYAARIQLVENVIRPALAEGIWVIGDRHDLSSQAYQGGGRGIDSTLMETLKTLVLGSFKPDLTLYLDIDPVQGLQRARARGELDRIEKESLDFFHRTRERYLELAGQDENIIIIDASRPLIEVSSAIRQTLTNWLMRQGIKV